MKKLLALAAVIMLLSMIGDPASAGWTVVNLHPAEATSSYAYGVSGGQQVGYAKIGNYDHAGLWSGTAGSWVDLSAAGASQSYARGVSGGRQVGVACFGGVCHAGLWSGTAASWVDLNPAGARRSGAEGVSGGQQVGYAVFVSHTHAALWSGTAASWVDLNPADATDSDANGVSDGQQVGVACFGGVCHAGLWSGTAASWVDLNPPGATSSEATGVSGGQQVGSACFGDIFHAGLWSGTAGSWVDLHPAGAMESEAFGVSGGQQAGTALFGGIFHAGMWSGTAESWVDLHALLPAGAYSESCAVSIEVSVGETWVAGVATSASTGQDEAMLWHYVPASPAIGIRACDLHNQLLPPNPVRTWGKVTSTSPLRISDGAAEIEVTGLNDLDVGDYLWVEGDWNGSVLAARQDPQKAKAYTFPSRTEMVYITAGSFLMGNSGIENDAVYHHWEEFPQHSVYLSGYWVGKYEVTRGEYQRFMAADGYTNPAYWSNDGWNWKVLSNRSEPAYWGASQQWGSEPFTQTDHHPVVGIHYYEADAFCNWAGSHLPTEAQWEKAARWTGTHPNVFPWGDVWDEEKCNNTSDHNPAGGGFGRGQTAPVGSYPLGIAPYGCQDMAGNAAEWVQDWYKSYPGAANPFDYTDSRRVMRGGAWFMMDYDYARCAYRSYGDLYRNSDFDGFRLAR